ncbi:hypothetical protein SVAN01_11431 [Stagonosporopsis vannaccii]|nr:hypothetical protein SVAN01_11431 [Stagonosporopsis vannaccii]
MARCLRRRCAQSDTANVVLHLDTTRLTRKVKIDDADDSIAAE